MMTKKDLGSLQEYKSSAGRVLSVYLDVDQSNPANLNRGFEKAFESRIQAIERVFDEEYERRDFTEAVKEVRKLLCAYQPSARGLIMFARSSGSIWLRELDVAIATDVRWSEEAYVQPFAEALDEFEMYAVVVADRARARLFTVKLGTMRKHTEIHAFGATRHTQTTGTDRLYSQSHFQRKADEHALSYLKRVVEVIENLATQDPFNRLILAGTNEATSELFRLLPKSLRARVVGSAVIPAVASDQTILEITLDIERKAERTREIQKVESLLTSAAKGMKAVATLPETLLALNEKRVRELLYAEGFALTGGVCKTCHAVFPTDAANCDFCARPVTPSEDLRETAIAMALASAATIEQVRGQAAEKLKTAGGIGAFLRF